MIRPHKFLIEHFDNYAGMVFASLKRQGIQVAAGISLLLLLTGCCFDSAAVTNSAQSHQANALWIESSNMDVVELGDRINLTVWVNMSEEVFVWQLRILFNSTYFNVSGVGYTAGNRSDFFCNHSTISISPILNNTEGYVIIGETLLGGDRRSPGCGSLVWIELNLTEVPSVAQSLVSFSVPYGDDTFVSSPYLEVIALDYSAGIVIGFQQLAQDTLLRDLLIIVAILGLTAVGLIVVKRRRSEKNGQ